MKKKRILITITARPHLARQLLLIKELKKQFSLDIWQPEKRTGTMASQAILYAVDLNNYLADKEYDAVIIRGDRFEMLGLAMVCAYREIKIIHIEGGDLSGVIDNKVRHAITELADYHFATNEESQRRVINMGVSPDKVWNFGSLDVEFADKVIPKRIKEKPYILVAYHAIEGEDEKELEKALESFKNSCIVKIGGNKDYGKNYGNEEYNPEDYINLMRFASVAVGNSSSLIKEASILGTPVVLIGDRQHGRLKPKNVTMVDCVARKIIAVIKYQMQNKYEKDLVYYQKDTSKKIVKKLREVL